MTISSTHAGGGLMFTGDDAAGLLAGIQTGLAECSRNVEVVVGKEKTPEEQYRTLLQTEVQGWIDNDNQHMINAFLQGSGYTDIQSLLTDLKSVTFTFGNYWNYFDPNDLMQPNGNCGFTDGAAYGFANAQKNIVTLDDGLLNILKVINAMSKEITNACNYSSNVGMMEITSRTDAISTAKAFLLVVGLHEMAHLGAARTGVVDGDPGTFVIQPDGSIFWNEAGQRFEMAAFGYLMNYDSPQAGPIPLDKYTNRSQQCGTNNCYIEANKILKTALSTFGKF